MAFTGTRWDVRIKRARKRGHFTHNDILAASDFTTCAVGERVEVDTLLFGVGYYDPELCNLGLDFCRLVEEGTDVDFDACEAKRKEIVARARELERTAKWQ
jgi:hypothetical protein